MLEAVDDDDDETSSDSATSLTESENKDTPAQSGMLIIEE